ncbi:MAG: alpha/beta hydrolase family protein [Euzebya sp.]
MLNPSSGQERQIAPGLAKPPAGLLLTPGASADRDHATLVAIDDGISEIAVERLTLGTTSIAKAVRLVEEAARALAHRLGVDTDRVALGGRSFGGRACSVAVAQGLPAAALVLLSYPLHPPGRPDRLRVEHFGDIGVPTLFLSGRKDPFGSPDEFAAQIPAVAGPVTTTWINGSHAPRGQDPTIVATVRAYLGL